VIDFSRRFKAGDFTDHVEPGGTLQTKPMQGNGAHVEQLLLGILDV
jgi:hypothetical protein